LIGVHWIYLALCVGTFSSEGLCQTANAALRKRLPSPDDTGEEEAPWALTKPGIRRNIRQHDHPARDTFGCDELAAVYHRTTACSQKVALGTAACL
jgi:hypothetical protein